MTDNNYLLPVWDLVGYSWKKVSGSKGTFWAFIGICILIMLGFLLVQKLAHPISHLIIFIGQIISYLLQMGLIYLGIRRAQDLPISYPMGFRAFEKPVIKNTAKTG